MTFKAPKPKEPEPRGDVEAGDHLYVHHQGQPCTGVVCAHGRHGVTVKIDGKHHKVKWENVLGHKKRVPQRYDVLDHGEDGMLVKDGSGRRRFLAMTNEAKENPMVAKAFGQRPVLLFTKAAGAPPGPGLQQKKITDKNGVQTTRWVSTEQGGPPAQSGQHVGFVNGDTKKHGQVLASGKTGVTVQDPKGGRHQVPHENVTHHWQGDGAPDHDPHEQPKEAEKAGGVQQHQGDPKTFNASAFARQHDDANATADSIIAKFGGDAKERIEAARNRLGGVKQTIEEHQENGQWNEKRLALHRQIMFEGVTLKNGKKVPGLLAEDRIKAATPAKGESPVFIALGGRGGSGKSKLNGLVYDESKAIVLDADHIKGMLPEYGGWNAHQVHEESSELLESVLTMAKLLRLNVVLDATMKTGKSIEDKIDAFKTAGFKTEAHYMHLPRHKAAERAIGRFLNGGETGRFVPPEVVMGNTKNEENFDKIKDKVDAWSFHDNSGDAKDAKPTLIAQSGSPATLSKKILIKSDQARIMLLWKGK